MMNMLTLENKIIVISGASAGIGRQCAITAANLDATLVIIGRNKDRLEETYAQLKPGKHRVLCCDITDLEKLKELLADTIASTGRVNGIIHSAGIEMTKPLQAMNRIDFENLFAVNVIAGFELSKILSHKKYISPDGGSFVFIGSVMGVLGQAGKIAYCASKGALIAGVKAMALELTTKKIRVNCVLPAVVQTEMSEKLFEGMPEESRQEIIAMHPLGLGTPEDVAHACLFLLSDAARWITGTNLFVDGGYSAR